MGTITQVSTREPVAALTFDDGPDPLHTPRLLDVLEKHGARATFFMVGQTAQRYPDVVRRVASGGHAIGNHSWDHPSFPLISGRERRAQIRACEQAVAPYGTRLFRPPYGHQSASSWLDVARLGYAAVTWNVAGYDWLDHDAAWIVEWLISQLNPGCVIDLHDGLFDAVAERCFDRAPTLEAVRILLERKGSMLRFVTVPELLRYGRPGRTYWIARPDPQSLNRLVTPDGSRHYAAAGGAAARPPEHKVPRGDAG